MDRISRGEIWTVSPVSHPKKPRPAVVVSINAINDLCPDILLVPITSKPGPLRVSLLDKPNATGLQKQSYAKCESVGPVHKSRLKTRIGTVGLEDLPKLEKGLRRVFGL